MIIYELILTNKNRESSSLGLFATQTIAEDYRTERMAKLARSHRHAHRQATKKCSGFSPKWEEKDISYCENNDTLACHNKKLFKYRTEKEYVYRESLKWARRYNIVQRTVKE